MALTQLKIAPTGMRLHEWIALERGYFQTQGMGLGKFVPDAHGIARSRWGLADHMESKNYEELVLG